MRTTAIIIPLIFFFLPLALAREYTLSIKAPNHHILVRENSEVASYAPNASLHLGLKITGDYFLFKFGTRLKGTEWGRRTGQKLTYQDFRLGIRIANSYTELFYKMYRGFNSNEKSGEEHDTPRTSLSSTEYTLDQLWALTPSYNLKQLTGNGGQGVRFATTWLLNVFVNRLKIREPSGIIKYSKADKMTLDHVVEFDLRQVGMGLGAALTVPIWPLFYMSASFTAGPGYQDNKIYYFSHFQRKKGVASHYNLKWMFGTYGLPVNIGTKVLFNSNIYDIGSNKNVASANYAAYLYMSFVL